jgi:hypothetical protein
MKFKEGEPCDETPPKSTIMRYWMNLKTLKTLWIEIKLV